MKLRNLLPLLAIVCCFTACSLEEGEGTLFKEPCTQWGVSKSDVRSFMKGYTLVDDEDEDYMSYMGVKTRNLLPYTVMYDYSFDIEYVFSNETMTAEKVDKGLWESVVYVMGTTEEQCEKLNEEFLAFFKEKYVEVPLSSLPEDEEGYEDDYEDEEDLETEIIAAFANDDKSLCIVVGTIEDMNTIVASYSYEF